MNKTVTWGKVEEICDELAKNMLADGCKGVLLGLGRGGLVPAVILSHKLKCPLHPIIWQTRDGGRKDKLLSFLLSIEDETTIYVVDDINDSGETFSQVTDKLFTLLCDYKKTSKIRVRTVSLFTRYSSKYCSDYFGETVCSDVFLEFPWETYNE